MNHVQQAEVLSAITVGQDAGFQTIAWQTSAMTAEIIAMRRQPRFFAADREQSAQD